MHRPRLCQQLIGNREARHGRNEQYGGQHHWWRRYPKDLHVAAVVDERDRVLGTRSFPTTRQGYRQMLAWIRTFAELRRIGIESAGSYGAGLLRYMQAAHIEVMEVTAPDRHDRRKRGKNDDLVSPELTN